MFRRCWNGWDSEGNAAMNWSLSFAPFLPWPVLGGVYFVEATKKVASVNKLPVPWKSKAPSVAARPVAACDGVVDKKAG